MSLRIHSIVFTIRLVDDLLVAGSDLNLVIKCINSLRVDTHIHIAESAMAIHHEMGGSILPQREKIISNTTSEPVTDSQGWYRPDMGERRRFMSLLL